MNNKSIIFFLLSILLLTLLNKNSYECFTQEPKKNVVVCLFGVIPRSIKYTYNSIQKNVINELKKEYNVDIYVFNLRTDGYMVDDTELNNEDIKIIPFDHYEERQQKDFDESVDLSNKVHNKWKMTKYYSERTNLNAIRQMYSEYRVGLFLEKNKNKYDGCLICGPDYYIANKLNLNDFEESLNNNIFFTSQVNKGIIKDGYINGFYFGKPKIVISILKRYTKINEYLPSINDYEYFVKKSCQDNSIRQKSTDILFFKIRASKKVFWDEDNSFLSNEDKKIVENEFNKITKTFQKI